MCMCNGLIDNFGNTMLLWLSDTLGTAAHTVKLLTVCLRSTVRNMGWVGLGYASSRNHGLSWVGSICCWVGLGEQMSISALRNIPSGVQGACFVAVITIAVAVY